jgi:hypothetical protein
MFSEARPGFKFASFEMMHWVHTGQNYHEAGPFLVQCEVQKAVSSFFHCTVGSGNLTNFLPQAVSAHSFKNFKML